MKNQESFKVIKQRQEDKALVSLYENPEDDSQAVLGYVLNCTKKAVLL